MNENLQIALTLLLIGMLTVFVVLLLVVLCGKLLIRIVNRLEPEAAVAQPAAGGISHEHLAVIVAAVDIITEGRGQLKEVEQVPEG